MIMPVSVAIPKHAMSPTQDATLNSCGGASHDHARNLGKNAGHGESDSEIFGVNQSGDFEGRFLVEVEGGVVGLFGTQAAKRWVAFQSWSLSGSRGLFILASSAF